MNSETYKRRFTEMLEKFDETYQQQGTHLKHAEFIDEQFPNASDMEKMVHLAMLIDEQRTNSLVYATLKEFLVTD